MTTQWSTFERWDLVLPPNRPTDRFLKVVRDILERHSPPLRAAVLGSTPEFRDLLAQCGAMETIVFDRDLPFHRRTTEMTLPLTRTTERLVLGDWLETLPDHEAAFDFLLSDLTAGNVPYSSRAQFYASIRRALRPGGIFVDRLLLHDFELLPLDRLDRKYRKRGRNLRSYNDFSSEYLFCSELLKGQESVDSSEFYGHLSQRFHDDEQLNALWHGAHLVTPEGAFWHYGRTASAVWEPLAHAFSRIRVLRDESRTVFSGKTRILLCNGE